MSSFTLFEMENCPAQLIVQHFKNFEFFQFSDQFFKIFRISGPSMTDMIISAIGATKNASNAVGRMKKGHFYSKKFKIYFPESHFLNILKVIIGGWIIENCPDRRLLYRLRRARAYVLTGECGKLSAEVTHKSVASPRSQPRSDRRTDGRMDGRTDGRMDGH